MTEQEKREIVNELIDYINENGFRTRDCTLFPIKKKWMGNNRDGHGPMWTQYDDPSDLYKLWKCIYQISKIICGNVFPKTEESVRNIQNVADSICQLVYDLKESQAKTALTASNQNGMNS